MSYETIYEWHNAGKYIAIDSDGDICVDGNDYDSYACIELPKSPVEVQALIEAIIKATGCELVTTAKSMSEVVKLGLDGVAMVVKRDQ